MIRCIHIEFEKNQKQQYFSIDIISSKTIKRKLLKNVKKNRYYRNEFRNHDFENFEQIEKYIY